MKKFATAIIVISSIFGVVKLGALDFLVMFLLVGEIPGTDYSLTPVSMIVVMSTCMLLTVIYLIPYSLTRQNMPLSKKRSTTKKSSKNTKSESPKPSLPHRRYSEI